MWVVRAAVWLCRRSWLVSLVAFVCGLLFHMCHVGSTAWRLVLRLGSAFCLSCVGLVVAVVVVLLLLLLSLC